MPTASSFKLTSRLLRPNITLSGSSKPTPAYTSSHLIRQSSSFIPGRAAADDPISQVPKPPSTNWFTTHPTLSDSLDFLDSLIHRTRTKLHEASVLKRFSAPATFSGTGVRLKWLKWRMEEQLSGMNDKDRSICKTIWDPQAKWHDIFTTGSILQGSQGRELRMVEYTATITKLNEIKSLKRYIAFLKNTQLSPASQTIDQLDQELDRVLLAFSKPDRAHKSIKDEEYGRDRLGRFYGVGKKKESTARAWMIEVQVPEPTKEVTAQPEITLPVAGDRVANIITSHPPAVQPETSPALRHVPLGQIICNGRSIADYFHTPRQRATALRALEITE